MKSLCFSLALLLSCLATLGGDTRPIDLDPKAQLQFEVGKLQRVLKDKPPNQRQLVNEILFEACAWEAMERRVLGSYYDDLNPQLPEFKHAFRDFLSRTFSSLVLGREFEIRYGGRCRWTTAAR